MVRGWVVGLGNKGFGSDFKAENRAQDVPEHLPATDRIGQHHYQPTG